MKYALSLIVFLAILSGCSDPEIDTHFHDAANVKNVKLQQKENCFITKHGDWFPVKSKSCDEENPFIYYKDKKTYSGYAEIISDGIRLSGKLRDGLKCGWWLEKSNAETVLSKKEKLYEPGGRLIQEIEYANDFLHNNISYNDSFLNQKWDVQNGDSFFYYSLAVGSADENRESAAYKNREIFEYSKRDSFKITLEENRIMYYKNTDTGFFSTGFEFVYDSLGKLDYLFVEDGAESKKFYNRDKKGRWYGGSKFVHFNEDGQQQLLTLNVSAIYNSIKQLPPQSAFDTLKKLSLSF